MSTHLDAIIDKHNQVCTLQVVFIDIEKYSQRRTSRQVTVINSFTESVKASLDEVAKLNIGFLQSNNLNFLTDIIIIPTGDGCAVNFTFDGLHNVHLKFAEILMKHIFDLNQSTPPCPKFNSNGWCNCHNKFNVKVGVTEGKGLIYKDVNKNYNVAGNTINMAARLLSIGGRNQILLNEDAYKQIIDLEDDPNFSDKFIKLNNVKIKHDISIDAYIYNPSLEYINGEIPKQIVIQDKMNEISKKFEEAGMPMPNLTGDNGNKIDFAELAVLTNSMFELISTFKKESDPTSIITPIVSLLPAEKKTAKKTRRSNKK